MSKDGGPAFPNVTQWDVNEDGRMAIGCEDGMSLRDYFAARAMQAMVSHIGITPMDGQPMEGAGMFAKVSYAIADAMLAERVK